MEAFYKKLLKSTIGLKKIPSCNTCAKQQSERCPSLGEPYDSAKCYSRSDRPEWEKIPSCETCVKRKSMRCPNSSECYSLINKPKWEGA